MLTIPQYSHLNFVVTAVQAIENEQLQTLFDVKQKEYSNVRGSVSTPQRVYHDTCATDEVWELIARNNLRIPNPDVPVATKTDGWVGNLWFGAGAYVSRSPDYCFKYCVDFQKGETIKAGLGLKVMCLDILPGRAFPMLTVQNGIRLMKDYDSHTLSL